MYVYISLSLSMYIYLSIYIYIHILHEEFTMRSLDVILRTQHTRAKSEVNPLKGFSPMSTDFHRFLFLCVFIGLSRCSPVFADSCFRPWILRPRLLGF